MTQYERILSIVKQCKTREQLDVCKLFIELVISSKSTFKLSEPNKKTILIEVQNKINQLTQ